MSEVIAKVVEFLKMNGPSHPVQIGKVLGKDTMMASAILSEVVSSGKVKMTQRKVGNSSLYFIAGQEDKVKEQLRGDLNLVEKKLLEKVENKSFIPHSELTTQDKFVLPGLRDFLMPLKVKYGHSELIVWKYYNVPNEKIMPNISEMLKKTVPKVEVKKEPEKKESIFEKKEVKKEEAEKEEPASVFQSKVEGWFSNYGIKVLKREVKRKGKQLEYVVKMQEPVEQEYYVKCKKKKRISDSDISLTYTEAMQRKMPAMFITSGKISKKLSKKIEKKFGKLVKVVKV